MITRYLLGVLALAVVGLGWYAKTATERAGRLEAEKSAFRTAAEQNARAVDKWREARQEAERERARVDRLRVAREQEKRDALAELEEARAVLSDMERSRDHACLNTRAPGVVLDRLRAQPAPDGVPTAGDRQAYPTR